jgi:hypothetical protein
VYLSFFYSTELCGLGSSFAGDQNKIQEALKCNLVLMKKRKGTKPLVLHFTPQPKNSRPIVHDLKLDQSDILSSPRDYKWISYTLAMNTDITSRQNGASPGRVPGTSSNSYTEAPPKAQETGGTTTLNDNLEVFPALWVHLIVVIAKLQI